MRRGLITRGQSTSTREPATAANDPQLLATHETGSALSNTTSEHKESAIGYNLAGKLLDTQQQSSTLGRNPPNTRDA